jgi:hypothetical protein
MTGKKMRLMRGTTVVLLAMLMFAVPAVAQARVLEYQLQYIPVGVGGVSQMIVNVIMAPDTVLPVTVRVPLPAGATVVWSGEIVGEDPALDPYREATVTATEGGQIVEFVLSEARVGQVEADYVAPTRSGTDVSASLHWVNTGEAAPLLVSVRLESGASGVAISPKPTGDPLTNEAGETLYALESLTLAPGDALDVKVSYDLGGSNGMDVTVPLIIVGSLLVVAIGGLTVAMRRDRRRRPTLDAPEVPADTDEGDELTF